MAHDGNVISLKAGAFKKRLEKLASDQSVKDADFGDAVYTAVTEFGVEENAFRDAFGMTKGAVERWMNLKSLPQPSVRAKILLWMAERVDNRI